MTVAWRGKKPAAMSTVTSAARGFRSVALPAVRTAMLAASRTRLTTPATTYAVFRSSLPRGAISGVK